MSIEGEYKNENFTFGDFTQEELNKLQPKLASFNNKNQNKSVEFPWEIDNEFNTINKSTNNNNNDTDNLNDIVFGFNIPIIYNYMQFKEDLKNNQNMDQQQQQSQTQRRNKKQRPPDYYKREYVEILKIEDENTLKMQQTQDTSSLTVENVNENFDNLKLNDTTLTSQPQQQQQQSPPPLPSPLVSSLVQEQLHKPEINNNIDKESSTSAIEESVLMLQETTNNQDTLIPVRAPSPLPPSTIAQPKAPTTKSWANLFKAGSTQQQQQQQQQLPSQTHVTKPLQQQQQQHLLMNKTHSDNNVLNQQTQNEMNHVRRTSSSSSFTNQSPQTQTQTTESTFDLLKSLGFMFKTYELKHSAPALQPRGLINKSNWCYINATLQALLACPPFFNLVKQIFNKTKNSAAANNSIPFLTALGRYVFEFKTMIRPGTVVDSQQKRSKELVIGELFDIEYFYEVLSSLKVDFAARGRQEDAQEFLSFLLNRLHEEAIKCLECIDPSTSKQHQQQQQESQQSKLTSNGVSSTSTSNKNEEEQDDEWQEVGKKNRSFVTRRAEFKQSPISDIFCGQFRSAFSQPGSREKESISLEPFFTLPLEIQPDKVRTVNDALEYFVQKEEILDFIHPETKQRVDAYKRISFEDLPPVLILYLKCFIYDKNGGIQKLLKRIDYQIELEISKELISSNQRTKLKDKKRIYKLFAVEYHQGDRATGGHYITDVYHPGIIGWVRFDDSQVKVVTNKEVLKSEDKKLVPYLLYYRRSDLI